MQSASSAITEFGIELFTLKVPQGGEGEQTGVPGEKPRQPVRYCSLPTELQTAFSQKEASLYVHVTYGAPFVK